MPSHGVHTGVLAARVKRGAHCGVRVHIGAAFVYEATAPTHSVWQIEPRPDAAHRLLREAWSITPDVSTHVYRDQFGNLCRRLTMPAGRSLLRYDAEAEVPAVADATDVDAREVPPEQLPDDALPLRLAEPVLPRPT